MKINKADHMIVLYQLIEENLFKGERFLMSTTEEVDVQLIDRDVVLTYDWYRVVFVDPSNGDVVRFRAKSIVSFEYEKNKFNALAIYRILRGFEEQNLNFIKRNSFNVLDKYLNVFYSSFLDAEITLRESHPLNFCDTLLMSLKK